MQIHYSFKTLLLSFSCIVLCASTEMHAMRRVGSVCSGKSVDELTKTITKSHPSLGCMTVPCNQNDEVVGREQARRSTLPLYTEMSHCSIKEVDGLVFYKSSNTLDGANVTPDQSDEIARVLAEMSEEHVKRANAQIADKKLELCLLNPLLTSCKLVLVSGLAISAGTLVGMGVGFGCGQAAEILSDILKFSVPAEQVGNTVQKICALLGASSVGAYATALVLLRNRAYRGQIKKEIALLERSKAQVATHKN